MSFCSRSLLFILFFSFILLPQNFVGASCELYRTSSNFMYQGNDLNPVYLSSSLSSRQQQRSKLPDYWFAESTGLDLIREIEIGQLSSRYWGMVDLRVRKHQSKMQYVFENLSFMNNSEKSQIYLFDFNFETFFKRLERSNKKYINLSLVFNGSYADRVLKTDFSRLIFIKSVGNFWVESEMSHFPEIERFKEKTKSLIVGSMSPIGVSSYYSEEGDVVDILAPVGRGIFLENANWKCVGKDIEMCYISTGTSTATALVSLALKIATTVLGEVSFAAIQALVKNTAIPTIDSQLRPGTNGAGVINFYKIFQVAKRVQNQCKNQKNVTLCIEELIQDKKSYQFQISQRQQQAQDYFKDLIKKGKLLSHSESCLIHKYKYDLVREWALLDPQDETSWELLAKISSELGKDVLQTLFLSFGVRKNYDDYFQAVEQYQLDEGYNRPKFLLAKNRIKKASEIKVSDNQEELELLLNYQMLSYTPSTQILREIVKRSQNPAMKAAAQRELDGLIRRGYKN